MKVNLKEKKTQTDLQKQKYNNSQFSEKSKQGSFN